MLDLMAVTPALEDAFAAREKIQFEGTEVAVIGRDGLRLMKLAAGRPKDLEDLRKLGLQPE